MRKLYGKITIVYYDLNEISNVLGQNNIDKRMFDMYNASIEQLFGTIVRGGITNEK